MTLALANRIYYIYMYTQTIVVPKIYITHALSLYTEIIARLYHDKKLLLGTLLLVLLQSEQSKIRAFDSPHPRRQRMQKEKCI